MNNATELVIRAKDRLEELGFTMQEISFYGKTYISQRSWVKGAKYIEIHETPRHNGTENDVTATIRVNIVENPIGVSRRLATFKIPKNASDKVIDNRLQKAITYMNLYDTVEKLKKEVKSQ